MSDEVVVPQDVTPSDSPTAPASTPAVREEVVSLAKFNGLNSHALTLKKKLDEANLKLLQISEQSESERVALATEATTWKNKAVEHETAAQAAIRERDQLKSRFEIGTLIRKDFPSLATTFDKGLLNHVETMTPEARAEYLTTFAAEFGQVHGDGVKKAVAGSSPALQTPGRTDAGADNSASLKQKVDALILAGKRMTPEYNDTYSQYMSALMNESLVK